MPIISVDSQIVETELLHIANQMILAATTAPKARGIDQLSYKIVYGEELTLLSNTMIQLGERSNQPFFIRDAKNILQSPVVVLLGCSIQPLNLNECNYCGHETCGNKSLHPNVPCAHNLLNLGIAVGIAASVANTHHIDNRIMFSAGKAALELKIFPAETTCVYAIPLSVSSKNIFFDRS